VIATLPDVYYSAQIFLLDAQFTRQYALLFGSHRYRSQGVRPAHAKRAIHRAQSCRAVSGVGPLSPLLLAWN
jgi:hypothetical protein